MSLGRKAIVGAGWLFAWRACSRLLRFASTLVLARLLVPSDFGLLAMALSFEVAIGALSAIPVYDALIRRPEEDTRLHDAAFTIQVARSLLTGLALAVSGPLAAAWFSEPRLIPILGVLGGIEMLNGFFNLGIVQFQRELRFDVQFRLQLLPALLQLSSTLAVAWLTHSYWALLIGIAAQRISRVGMSYVIHPYRPRFSLRGYMELIGFSFWLWLGGLATMVWDQIDNFVLGPLFGSAVLGVYVMAGQVAGIPFSEFLEPLTAVLFASFAYAQRSKTTEGVNPVTVAGSLLLIMAPMAVVISAESNGLVHLLLGTRWIAAVPLVAIAAWRVPLLPFYATAQSILIARGRVKQNFCIILTITAIRVALVTAAALAGSITLVIEASIVVLSVGVVLYGWALWSDLRDEAVRFGAGIVRIVIATAGAGILLREFGLGWQAVGTSQGLSASAMMFLHVAIAAGVAGVSYIAVLAALWLAVGRPDGPEEVLLSWLKQILPVPLRASPTRPSLPSQ